jgi:hypothetical protein
MESDKSAVLADQEKGGKGWDSALTDSDVHLEVVGIGHQYSGWSGLPSPVKLAARRAFEFGSCRFKCRLGPLEVEFSAVPFHTSAL